jgi:hypothetical protein
MAVFLAGPTELKADLARLALEGWPPITAEERIGASLASVIGDLESRAQDQVKT